MSKQVFDPSAVELSGLLQKRGGSSLSRWKFRWFALQNDRLYYYRTKQDDEPIGYIPLQKVNYVYNSADIAYIPSKLQGCGFVIDTGKKSYFMLANDRQEMWKWVDTLEKLRKHWAQPLDASTSLSKTLGQTTLLATTSSSESINGVEGYLLKKGPSNVTGFKQRYFILHEGVITYFKKRGDEDFIRQIPLLSINYITPTNNIPGLAKKHHGMSFLIDAENHILYLIAPTKDNMWFWINEIQSAKKKLEKSGVKTGLRASLTMVAKQTPRKNYDKLSQMITSPDHLLMSALSEVVRDKLPVAAALYSLHVCQGKTTELLKWGSIHHVAIAESKSQLQKWDPTKELVTVAIPARYVWEFDNALVIRFSALVIHALDQLGDEEPEPKSIIKLLVDLMIHSWGNVTWPFQQMLTQYRVALSVRFIISDTEAFATTLLYLLHILLSPTYPTYNFLEEQDAVGSVCLTSGSPSHLTPPFETISKYLASEDTSQPIDVFMMLCQIVQENHDLISRTASISGLDQSSKQLPEIDIAEVEKQALGIIHHQLSVNVDSIGDFISRNKSLYDFMEVEIEHVEQIREEEVVVVQRQHQELIEEIEYEVLGTGVSGDSAERNATQEDELLALSNSIVMPRKQAGGEMQLCVRPKCSCSKYEPHPLVADKCDNCFHTKSEHVRNETAGNIVPRISRKIVGNEVAEVNAAVPSRETIPPQQVQDIVEEITEEIVSVDLREEFEEVEQEDEDTPEPRKLETPFKEAFGVVDQLFIVLALCDVGWLRERNYGQLVKILGSANFATVEALYLCTRDTDRVAKSVVCLFDASGLSLSLLKWSISREVANTTSDSILFRTDSLATKLWKAYTTTVGLNYLRSTLGPCIMELLENPTGHEVDPNRAKPDEDPVKNMATLIMTCQKFYNSFKESVESCPIILKLVCRHLYVVVAEKFPGSEYSAVGGFMFLRYFCGGIMTPEKYGVFEGTISPEGRRALILVAKILQNLNNGVEFDGAKESFMMGANVFIQEKLSDLKLIYDSFAQTPEDTKGPLAVPSRSTFVNAQMDLEFLHSEISAHLDEISSKLASLVSTQEIPRPVSHQKKVRIRTTRKIKTITKVETTKRITQVLKPIAVLSPIGRKTAFSLDTIKQIEEQCDIHVIPPVSTESSEAAHKSQETDTNDITFTGTLETSAEVTALPAQSSDFVNPQDEGERTQPTDSIQEIDSSPEKTQEFDQEESGKGTVIRDAMLQDSHATPSIPSTPSFAESLGQEAEITTTISTQSDEPTDSTDVAIMSKTDHSLENTGTEGRFGYSVGGSSRMRAVSRISVLRKGVSPFSKSQPILPALSSQDFNPFREKATVERSLYHVCRVAGCKCADPELHAWLRTKCKNCFHDMKMHERPIQHHLSTTTTSASTGL